MNPAIVVIAYNREKSLNRLLNSINAASFSGLAGSVPLIISIDKSDNSEVAKVAEGFKWQYGEKRVVTHDENLGLKKHVLSCGEYTNEYEGIIVLEDDLYVAKDFYSYAQEALSFSESDDRIAGVSLYNHMLNVHVREPFEAIDDGYDNYYMQFAQSWGQAYTKKQWSAFSEWMRENDNVDISDPDIPENVSSWSDKSWLKYFIKYVIENDKYFIYPRLSRTTNFGDEGTHAQSADNDLQVPLACTEMRNYRFSTLSESHSVYDAFFENKELEKIAGIDGRITVDLYGYRSEFKSQYLLSSRSLPYSIVKSFGRNLRPIDANVLNETEGNDLFLYDTKVAASAPLVRKAARVLYNYRALNVKKMMEVIKFRLLKK